ncbi:MAG: hypothetical protein ABI581_04800 [Sediminibacterium sp.]
MKDPDPKKQTGNTEDTNTKDIPGDHDEQYVEPEAIDGQEPEDLDSDDERV